VQGEKLNDAIVNFHLELVDGVFFLENALGELFIAFQNRVYGLMNGALREAAHPEQPFFHLVDVFFKVAFHESLNSGYLKSSLTPLPVFVLKSFRQSRNAPFPAELEATISDRRFLES
jgi:hypothetical protein